MSKLKHTPGPWKYDDGPLRMRIYSEFDYDIVCHMVGNSASSMIQKIEIKNANARLVAAAPEMLEALIDNVKCQKLSHGAWDLNDVAIIERATGLTIEEVLKCTE